jgi:hypothetical protein
MAAALFAFILDWVPAPRRGPWDSFAPIIPERRGTVEGVMHFRVSASILTNVCGIGNVDYCWDYFWYLRLCLVIHMGLIPPV